MDTDHGHPSPEWHENIMANGTIYPITVWDAQGDITIAPYICVNENDGNPIIHGMVGQECPVSTQPLHACEVQSTQPALSDYELGIFQTQDNHTAKVDQALSNLDDLSLQAEVYQYRAGLQKERKLTDEICRAHDHFNDQ